LSDFVGFGSTSALSGSVSDSIGGHVYIGFNPADPTKQFSVGGKIGFNFSDNDTLLLMLDINGDHLPDKVFKAGNGAVYFRLNQSGPNGTTTFGTPTQIATLPALAEESSITVSFGAEAYIGVNALINDAETFTTGSVYFSDVNGDGLPDLVNGGAVLFNHLANGVPTFTSNSFDTPVPIGNLAVDPNGLVEDLTQVYDKAVENFPLHNTLRRWVAPYDGEIAISGAFNLIQDLSPARAAYQTADGVRVAIERRL
jgi:hypothetical protein